MEHTALYRKWRPQNFNTVVGQEETVRVLRNAVIKNRVSHAYLFCGTRGTGKTSTARILAKALNCTDLQNGEPCNHCDACTAITEGSFLDVIEIDAASNRGIEEARNLLEKVAFVPVVGKRKVYIIDECHMLTNEAFNALLKTFEEPPDHVVFILATTEIRKVPLTIRSRCQRFDFRNISDKDLFRTLCKIADAEQITADDDAIELLTEQAKGSMRDALTLMDQLIGGSDSFTAEDIQHITGGVSYEFWPAFFRNIADNDLPAVFRKIDVLQNEGKDLRRFFRDFRDVAGDLISGASEHRQGRYAGMLKQCANPFSPEQILEIITICGESEIIFRYNQDGKSVCRFLTAKIMKALHTPATPLPEAPAQAPAVPKPEEKAKPAEDFVFPNEIIAASESVKPAASPQTELPPWEEAPAPPPEAECPPWEDIPAPSAAEEQSLPKVEREIPQNNLPKPSAPVEDEEEELWANILKQVRELNPPTFTWLNYGTPEVISEKEVVVSYPINKTMHFNRINEPEHQKNIAEALKNIFNQPVSFRAELEGAKTAVEEQSLFPNGTAEFNSRTEEPGLFDKN